MRQEENNMSNDTETLRKQLLNEVCAGVFSGLGAMILDVEEIKNAGAGELEEIAQRHRKK